MSKTQLKKHLSLLTKDQITDIVLGLYDARKEAKSFLEFYLAPDFDTELKKCKTIIQKEFPLIVGYGFAKNPSFAKCRKVIADFQKLKPDPDPAYVADLMLFYIEQGCEYTMEFGDMWEQFYTALENGFNRAMQFIFIHGLLDKYCDRIEKMISSVSVCGWGFPDTLQLIFDHYKLKNI